VVFFVVAVVVEYLFYTFVRSKGVNITGDEPAYIMEAQALSHGSVHILPTAVRDLANGTFRTTYPPGATTRMVEQFGGPQGVVSPFAPGVGALLLVFVAVFGAVKGAVVGALCINTAGLMWLHQRISRLTGLGPLAQAVLAVAFALPPVLIASNQIYPDLPAGILIAIGLVEVAGAELTGRMSPLTMVMVTVSAGVSPWLQPKNLVAAAVVMAAFAFVAWRQGAVKGPAVVVGLVLLSVIAFLLYNHHYYGHWLGLPEPSPKLSRFGAQLTLGLLFDRDMGLFVQVPWTLIGLAGLVFYGWRRLPAAAVATVVTFVAILVLNGTYTSNPYGGLAPAGRFMWTLIPIALPWLALVLARVQDRRRSMLWPLGLAVVAWIWQAEPVFANRHQYYNPLVIDYPIWPTWWPKLTRLLPQFGRTSSVLGTHAWALLLELVVEAVAVAGLLLWLRGPAGRSAAPALP
jgi:hypothetical protein